MLLQKKRWEDFEVGQKLITGALTVTETHMVTFAGLTGDYYPLHMNEEYAKKSQFRGRIVHGPLTYCLAVGLVGQSGIFGDSLVAFLGAEKIVNTLPVRPEDTIYVEVEVCNKRETSKPDRGVTSMLYSVMNQRDEKVLEAQLNFLMKRREN